MDERSEAILVSVTANPLQYADHLVFPHIFSSLISQSFSPTDPFPATKTSITAQESLYIWTSGHFSLDTKWII